MGDFFRMSKGEFVGTVILLFIILALMAAVLLYHQSPPPPTDLSDFVSEVTAFEKRQRTYADSVAQERASRDSAYRNRYASRYDYSKNYRHYDTTSRSVRYPYDTTRLRPIQKKESYRIQKVDLNLCDTSDITRVPQFGSKRALKIVEYRDKLGGFHSFEQLREIYILQNIDLEYCQKYFTINPNHIKKIEVNKLSYKELKSHPYFDAYLAKTIVNYRNANGKIHSIAEFQKVTHAYQELMDKLSPYLSFD